MRETLHQMHILRTSPLLRGTLRKIQIERCMYTQRDMKVISA